MLDRKKKQVKIVGQSHTNKPIAAEQAINISFFMSNFH